MRRIGINLNHEWLAYIATLDHGYDFDRMAIDFESHGLINEGGGAYVTSISADRGWQSSGKQLEAGKSYEITATGRYQIAVEEAGGQPQVWPCEPGGVTIEYHDGHPLGMLLAAIVPTGEALPGAENSFTKPAAIGLRSTIKPEVNGTLYLRVNDSAAKLADNQGSLTVTIQRCSLIVVCSLREQIPARGASGLHSRLTLPPTV